MAIHQTIEELWPSAELTTVEDVERDTWAPARQQETEETKATERKRSRKTAADAKQRSRRSGRKP